MILPDDTCPAGVFQFRRSFCVVVFSFRLSAAERGIPRPPRVTLLRLKPYYSIVSSTEFVFMFAVGVERARALTITRMVAVRSSVRCCVVSEGMVMVVSRVGFQTETPGDPGTLVVLQLSRSGGADFLQYTQRVFFIRWLSPSEFFVGGLIFNARTRRRGVRL